MIVEDDYRAIERDARRFVVAHILKTAASPELRRLNRELTSIDPTGKLLCAWYRQVREMTDRLITPKGWRPVACRSLGRLRSRTLAVAQQRTAADHRRIRRADENGSFRIAGRYLRRINATAGARPWAQSGKPGRAPEPRNKLPPSYSMTSSAMATRLGGMVRPSALAVLRLMTNSNLVEN
jgi:hypothetical protein